MDLQEIVRRNNMAKTAEHSYAETDGTSPANEIADKLGLLQPTTKKLAYPSYHSRKPDAVCDVIIAPHPINAAVLIEREDNRGTSVTNQAELIGTFVRHDFGDALRAKPLFIECYYELPPDFEVTFDRLVCDWDDGAIQTIEWHPCGKERNAEQARALLEKRREQFLSP